MKFKITSILIILFLSAVFCKNNEEYVVSKSSHLALYRNRNRNPNEPAVARVTNSEILKVQKKRDSYLFVSTGNGERGWVKKWLVKPMNINVTAGRDLDSDRITLAANQEKDAVKLEVTQ